MCLNEARRWKSATKEPTVIGEQLLEHMIEIYLTGAQSRTLSLNRLLLRFELAVPELQSINVTSIPEDQRRAFFLNIYLVLLMHSHTVRSGVETWRQRRTAFNNFCYNIGDQMYTLDDIEHGVLRNNERHPHGFRRQFGAGDPRMEAVVSLDPRVHFALACGSRSSPAIRMYHADKIDEELSAAARNYLMTHVTINVLENSLILPMQFKWYKKDFGGDWDSILRFIARFLSPERARSLLTLVGTPVEVRFKRYDWSWNFRIEADSSSAPEPVVGAEAVVGAQAMAQQESAKMTVEIVQKVKSNFDVDNPHGAPTRKQPTSDPRQGIIQMLASEFDRKTRRFNIQLSTLGVLSIVVYVIQMQVGWNGAVYEDTTTTEVLKAIVSVLTILLLIRLTMYYRYQRHLEKFRFGFNANFGLGTRWSMYGVEAVICAIHSPPYAASLMIFDRPFINELWSMCTFLRLYLLARVVRDHSELYRHRKELVSSRGGKWDEIQLLSSFSMTIKYLFQERPWLFLTAAYASSILLMSESIYLAERTEQPERFSFSNALWFTGVTMTTVGYGDFAVRAPIARFVSFFAALFGLVLSSMIFAAITSKLSPSLYQKFALKFMQDSRIDKVARTVAATIVQLRWRYWRFSRTKHQLPAVTRRRLEGMFAIKSLLYSARFQKLRRDKKVGTRYDHMLDLTDVKLLERVAMVDAHMASRFTWLDARLHAIMLELYRMMRPEEEEIFIPTGGLSTTQARRARGETSEGTPRAAKSAMSTAGDKDSDLEDYIRPGRTLAELRAERLRDKTRLPRTNQSIYELTRNDTGESSAQFKPRVSSRYQSAHGAAATSSRMGPPTPSYGPVHTPRARARSPMPPSQLEVGLTDDDLPHNLRPTGVLQQILGELHTINRRLDTLEMGDGMAKSESNISMRMPRVDESDEQSPASSSLHANQAHAQSARPSPSVAFVSPAASPHQGKFASTGTDKPAPVAIPPLVQSDKKTD